MHFSRDKLVGMGNQLLRIDNETGSFAMDNKCHSKGIEAFEDDAHTRAQLQLFPRRHLLAGKAFCRPGFVPQTFFWDHHKSRG